MTKLEGQVTHAQLADDVVDRIHVEFASWVRNRFRGCRCEIQDDLTHDGLVAVMQVLQDDDKRARVVERVCGDSDRLVQYCFTIGKNKAVRSYQRIRKRRDRISLEDISPEGVVTNDAEFSERSPDEIFDDALKKLTLAEQSVVRKAMRIVDKGWGWQKKLAEELGVTEAWITIVKGKFERALRSVQR